MGSDLRVEVDSGLSYTAHRRLAGISAAMAELGLEFVDQVACDDWEPEVGHAAVQDLLGRVRPTALLCLNDRLAVGGYHALADARPVGARTTCRWCRSTTTRSRRRCVPD